MKTRAIVVIDLKAFYACVECIDRGLDPFSVPLVVADVERGDHTIVLSVSPFLKKQGIPSRLRINELPKNHQYIFAKPRMKRYIQRSNEVISVLLKFVSEKDIHIYSIDEAFIDLTSYLKYYNLSVYELARKILHQIKNDTGLTATAGIGDNMFLSKVALDVYAKKSPDGIASISKDEIKTKLWTISPLHNVWGIGQRMETRLNLMNIFSLKDLANTPKDILTSCFGVIGEQLYWHANGVDNSDLAEPYIPSNTSIGIGQVLPKAYSVSQCRLIVKEMCEDLFYRLFSEHKKTKCIHLYLGFDKSGSKAKQLSLPFTSNDLEEITSNVLYLFDTLASSKSIRKVSISFSCLSDNIDIEQLGLFVPFEEKKEKKQLYSTIFHIRQKYGENSLLKLSALLDYSTAIERHNQIGGHHQ